MIIAFGNHPFLYDFLYFLFFFGNHPFLYEDMIIAFGNHPFFVGKELLFKNIKFMIWIVY
jgi:hypothetical protein